MVLIATQPLKPTLQVTELGVFQEQEALRIVQVLCGASLLRPQVSSRFWYSVTEENNLGYVRRPNELL